MDGHNMIAGSQLAERHVEQTMSSSSASTLRIAWREVRFPVRIIAKLRAAIEARAPVGYEDETGFHYSLKASDWFFSI
ncbi:MAG: hypothetical protein ABSH15_08920 [Verrucomicrobiota bacterium]